MGANGGKRPGAGRKPKAEELKIVNAATEAITNTYGGLQEGFEALLKSKEPSLVKWVFEHAAGKPQDKVDITSKGEKLESGKEIIFRDYGPKP